MIPKIVHYCWLSNDPIPDKFIKCMDTWKLYLPEYEFYCWDLNRFDINQSLWVKQAFESRRYAFAADYIRLYAVYHYGGIYLDMDVEVCRSFTPLLEKGYILGYENENGIEAGVFGGEKEDSWIKKCLDYYDDRLFIKPDGTYDMIPLPKIMLKQLSKDLYSFNILPPEYLTAKSYATGEVFKTRNTYSIHHFAGSWYSKAQRMFKYIAALIGKENAHKLAIMLKKIHVLR